MKMAIVFFLTPTLESVPFTKIAPGNVELGHFGILPLKPPKHGTKRVKNVPAVDRGLWCQLNRF